MAKKTKTAALKIGVLGQRGMGKWRLHVLVGKSTLALQVERGEPGSVFFNRRSDCERSAKRIAAALGCAYAVEE